MRVYFGPLEGITDVYYRRVHHACFGGVTKYYMPFISPTARLTFSSREQAALSPELNAGLPVAPQVLTREAALFVRMTELLRDAGFGEVNLNMGCPSGTVTAKGKGAAMLRDLEALRRFLDEVYEKAALPVSIKTRVGYESVDEWEGIVRLLSDYPMSELVIHSRTRSELYRGTPHNELYALALEVIKAPVILNGNLYTARDCRAILASYPGAAGVMCGRGLIANPALAQEAQGGEKLTRESLKHFHDALLETYRAKWPPKAVLGHMHEIMSYMACCFEDAKKPAKAIRKSASVAAYQEAAQALFETCKLKEIPAYGEG